MNKDRVCRKTSGLVEMDRFVLDRTRSVREMQYMVNDSRILSKMDNGVERILNDQLELCLLDYDQQLERILNVFEEPKRSMFTTTELYTSKLIRGIERKYEDFTRPELVLDAPGMMDDFYLNLVDWGESNLLAVGLRNSVYLWNTSTRDIQLLTQASDKEESRYISSVRFIREGGGFLLAIGLSNGVVQVWDVFQRAIVYQCNSIEESFEMLSNRVPSISSLDRILSFGTRFGRIHNYDLRSACSVGEFRGHNQEVCGLEWSLGTLLASGGNDNIVCIWDVRNNSPVFKLEEHQAAVKAMGWCPFRQNVLATGGGSGDRMLRIWNTHSGKCIEQKDTQSQICGLKWSQLSQELVTGHGYARNELIVWGYPYLLPVCTIPAHKNRVLHLTLSPDNTTVVSAASDENLKFWRVFRTPKTPISHLFDKHSLSFRE